MSQADDLHRELGLVIRGLRLEQSMSQERLADLTGLSRNYISDVERGLKSPSLRVIAALAAALGRRPHELLLAAEQR